MSSDKIPVTRFRQAPGVKRHPATYYLAGDPQPGKNTPKAGTGVSPVVDVAASLGFATEVIQPAYPVAVSGDFDGVPFLFLDGSTGELRYDVEAGSESGAPQLEEEFAWPVPHGWSAEGQLVAAEALTPELTQVLRTVQGGGDVAAARARVADSIEDLGPYPSVAPFANVWAEEARIDAEVAAGTVGNVADIRTARRNR